VAADPEVSAWFKDLDHPLKKPMLEVRKIIKATDRRMTETIKWKSPTFVFEGNMASIDPKSRKHVQLMFHQGAHSLVTIRGWRVAEARFAICGSRTPTP
jgi:hypothetical protein